MRAGAIAAAAAVGMLAWRFRPGESLQGDVALVTGGSRGLGFLISRTLLERGCRVAICGRDAETLAQARDRLERETGGSVTAYQCDVGDVDAVAAMMDRLMDELGGLDVLVNNAATIQVGPRETMDLEAYHRAMDIAFWGTVHTTRAALPHMLRQGRGRIANITSIGAAAAVPHLLPYDAAKHAVLGYSEGLRAELDGSGVSVTTVMPGLMRTGSPVHVEYRGQTEKEYAWFAAGDILPVTSINAVRAAHRIVLALSRRETRVVLSWPARILRLAHHLAPTLTVRVLGVANRLLPDAGGREDEVVRGRHLRGTLPDPIEGWLDSAASEANQFKNRQ